jgi:hypothetical protein
MRLVYRTGIIATGYNNKTIHCLSRWFSSQFPAAATVSTAKLLLRIRLR